MNRFVKPDQFGAIETLLLPTCMTGDLVNHLAMWTLEFNGELMWESETEITNPAFSELTHGKHAYIQGVIESTCKVRVHVQGERNFNAVLHRIVDLGIPCMIDLNVRTLIQQQLRTI